MMQCRRVKITDLEAHAKAERLYICLELYHRICYVWEKFMLPKTIFSVSLAIILTGFVSIRYSGRLPFMYYLIFPITVVTLMLLIFWLSHDVVLLTRDCEDILSRL